MAPRTDIRPQMQVLTSDRAFLGTVDGFDGDDIRVNLTRAGEGHQIIPASWIERVDEHVHLNRAGAEVEVGLKAAGFNKPAAKAASPASAPSTGGNKKLLLWAALAIVILLLLMMLF